MKPDSAQSVYDLKKKTSFCWALHSDNVLEGIQIDHQSIKCTSKAAIFPFGQANEDNMVSLAMNSGGNGFYSDKFHSGPDVASHSSFSIDSGPSGSSDGCAVRRKTQRTVGKPSSSQSLSAMALFVHEVDFYMHEKAIYVH
ncbi:uncharacterized protein LOC141631203 [Silene latifolia]|uniref:uncharacterized protein LOC141631203 n=1 Tax=Silene latifolia TaxID=37657 RepID=UPI003D770C07